MPTGTLGLRGAYPLALLPNDDHAAEVKVVKEDTEAAVKPKKAKGDTTLIDCNNNLFVTAVSPIVIGQTASAARMKATRLRRALPARAMLW